MLDIFCGDCIELMKSMPNDSIDMILTDPPYCSGGTTAQSRKSETSIKYTAMEYNGAEARSWTRLWALAVWG